jgi:acetyl esterase/lipase
MPVNVGPATAPPRADPTSPLQKLELQTETGEMLVIESQVQLYAQNSMLNHPLISPALSYLGGLPPLFFIAGDKEVLRDEIIYA